MGTCWLNARNIQQTSYCTLKRKNYARASERDQRKTLRKKCRRILTREGNFSFAEPGTNRRSLIESLEMKVEEGKIHTLKRLVA